MDVNFGQDHVMQTAWDSEYCCAVLGNASGAHLLIDLDRAGYPLDEGQLLKARLANYFFCGVIGFVRGEVGVTAEAGCGDVMLRAIPDFVGWLKGKFADQAVHDIGRAKDIRELVRLFNLPDTREN
jgi:hypothetical protein